MNLKLMVVSIGAASLLLSSCGGMNNAMTKKYKTTEHYRIFDIQTSTARFEMTDFVSDGVGRYVTGINESRPIPDGSPLPEKAARFKIITQQFSGNMAAFMARSGQSAPKSVRCEGAAWVGNAHRPHAGTTGGISFTACLFPYAKGYHLDFYSLYTKKEGFTLNPFELGKKLGASLAGSPESFVDQTVSETVQFIHDNIQGKILYLEGYPKYAGLPWEVKPMAAK